MGREIQAITITGEDRLMCTWPSWAACSTVFARMLKEQAALFEDRPRPLSGQEIELNLVDDRWV